jgi:hypothetical protein
MLMKQVLINISTVNMGVHREALKYTLKLKARNLSANQLSPQNAEMQLWRH